MIEIAVMKILCDSLRNRRMGSRRRRGISRLYMSSWGQRGGDEA
jgi:hypothetical protein